MLDRNKLGKKPFALLPNTYTLDWLFEDSEADATEKMFVDFFSLLKDDKVEFDTHTLS